MIELIKILEGGIDLRTGREEPKSVILQNGDTQAIMPLSHEQFEVILSLLGSGQHEQVEQRPGPVAPPPAMPTVSDNGEAPPIFSDPGEDEPEVGETYDDPETGVAAY